MAPSTDRVDFRPAPFSKSRPKPLGTSTTICVLPLRSRRSASAADVIGGCTEKYREPEKPSSSCRLCGVLVLIECRHLQVFDIEGNAVAERQHQDDGTKHGKGEPDRIAQQARRSRAGHRPTGAPNRTALAARRGSASIGAALRRGASTFFVAVDSGRVGEIADERVLQRVAAALLDQIERRADRQHLARVHERNAVAALRFVHEVGRKKDRDAVVARQIDQRAPERIARDRIDARRRLVENENGRLVQHRHRKLQVSA